MNRHILKQWLLPDMGQKERNGINEINIRMINRIVPLFTTLTLILLLFYAVMSIVSPEKYRMTLLIVLVCALLFVLALIVFRRLVRDPLACTKRSTEELIDIAYWAFSIWGIFVSWQMYVHNSQMLLMDTVQIAFALFICAYPLWGILRVSISYLILYIALYRTDGAAQINLAIYCLMAAMLCFGTILRYGMELRNLKQMHSLTKRARTLEKQSNHDTLTGMKNRLALREDFSSFCGNNLWVIMADIDHFKRYNDTYGHEVGDQILVRVASEIMNLFGKDSTYRYGGDEFLIIQKDYSPSEISALLIVWAEAIQNIRLDFLPEEDNYSCSYGYVDGRPSTEEGLREMIVRADKKLYEMKRRR